MAADRLRILQGYMKSGRLLEVGCASVEFLALAQGAGFDVQGVDSSKMFVEFNRQNGIDVEHGRVEDFDFPPHKFDVIALFHLIEHVEDPVGFVQALGPLLQQDGLVFIATPNLGSLTSRIFGRRYPGFVQHDHLTFFVEDTLSDVLRRGGFDIVNSFSKEYSHHLFSSTLGFLGDAVRARRQLPSNTLPGDDGRPAESVAAASGMAKRTLAKAVGGLPSVLGFFLYPVLRPVGLALERTMKGHELLVIAQPSRPK
ncbi:MAG: class I SAM-dependent methyltransferase [Chloroflexi bacterium]|nr:class I SAM-dependent methyltransferase [Chloroflexota bacterium]